MLVERQVPEATLAANSDKMSQGQGAFSFLQGVAMEFEGTVRNGVIVVEGAEPLPEGASVRVVVEDQKNKPTLVGFLKYAGVLSDMPADFAEQHDHYIHGTPRR